MEDYLKGNRNMVRKAQPSHNNTRAPYSSAEMSCVKHVSQGKLGIGVASPHSAKMPEYGVAYKVLSVKNGHHDVKGKI